MRKKLSEIFLEVKAAAAHRGILWFLSAIEKIEAQLNHESLGRFEVPENEAEHLKDLISKCAYDLSDALSDTPYEKLPAINFKTIFDGSFKINTEYHTTCLANAVKKMKEIEQFLSEKSHDFNPPPPPPNNQISSIFSSPSTPYEIFDNQGSNYANSIESDGSGGCFIKGQNASGAQRFIHLHSDGSVTGFGEKKELGYVEKLLYEKRDEISAHFKQELPNSHKSHQQQSKKY